MGGHLGHDQLRHLPHEALDFVHAPDHMANAFWVADPVVLKAFWCAGELDRPCHPIPPESSTISWPEEFDPHPKHLFMQPTWGIWPKTRPSRKAPIPDQGISARPRPIPTFGRTLPSWLSRCRKIHREPGHKKPPCIRTGGLRCRSALLFGGFSTMGWGALIGIPPDGDHPSD